MNKKYTEDFLNNCCKLYTEGASISKIASEYGVDRHILSKHIKEKLNLTTLKRSYGSKSIYTIDENFFNFIDTEEKAYWLGFLYADGYLKKDKPVIELALKYDDINHIEKFKNSIDSNHKIYIRNIKLKDKEYQSCRICLHNKQLYNSLIKHGCINNKSKIIKYPDFLTEDLERHFIRGFFDGDGNISLESNSVDRVSRVRFFSGSEDFIKTLSYKLNYLLDTDIGYSWDRTCFSIVYGRKSDKIKLLNYMYKDCTIYLDRKFNVYKKYACRFES